MAYITSILPMLVVAAVVWLVATAMAVAFGRLGRAMGAAARKATAATADDASLPSFTIVVATRNQAEALNRNLPAMLNQDYPDFEVIVADMASDDDTATLLEAMAYAHPHLRYTRTPASARDISVESLALSLALRAARSEWVALATADTQPPSTQWLRTLAREATPQRTLLIGPVSYAREAPLRIHFERLWATATTYSHIRRGLAPLLAVQANVAMRRTTAMEQLGAHRSHDLRHGALELLANSNRQPRTVAWLTDGQAILTQDAPTDTKAWRRDIVVEMETRRHARHIVRYALANALAMLQPWLVAAAFSVPLAASIAAAMAATGTQATPPVAPIATAAVLAVMLIAHIAVKAAAAMQTARRTGTRMLVPAFLWFEMLRPLAVGRIWWSWMLTPHNEFRKKFV